MNPREKASDLVERYLYAIGEELPRAQRDDVQAELRSLLSEQLDERIAGGAPPENAALDLLHSFGEPDEVATRYAAPGQYLIGPRWYPHFLVLVKFTFCFVPGLFLFWTLFGFLTGNSRLPEFMRPDSLSGWFIELVRLLAVNLATLVGVFAALERVFKRSDSPAEATAESWNPADLPPVPEGADPDKISESAVIAKIYVIVVLAVMLNFFPRWFGIMIFSSKGALTIPYTVLGVVLPIALINVWWAGALAQNVWLLNMRRWTRETRWMELLLGVFSGAILFLVISASSFALDPEWLGAQRLLAPERVLRIVNRGLPWFGSILRFSLSVILLATVIEAVVRLVRILRRYPPRSTGF